MKANNLELDRYRITSGDFGTAPGSGNNGAFKVPRRSYILQVIASDGEGWDHVSVSLNNRNPNWDEMCFIKELFFKDDETVIQFHPKRTEYVNNHPHCLHLWRKQKREHELPSSLLVGIKEKKQ